jgi:hypothetical protein
MIYGWDIMPFKGDLNEIITYSHSVRHFKMAEVQISIEVQVG